MTTLETENSSQKLLLNKQFIQKPSPTLLIQEEILKKQKNNEEVFSFGFGGSPLPPPTELLLAYTSNIAKNYYPPTQGVLELRETISSFYKRLFCLDNNANDIFIFPGSKEGIFQALSILDGPLLLPRGSWVSYAPQANILKKETIWIETYEKNNYKLCSQDLEEKCRTLKSAQKILILNSPNNPIGHIYSKEELINIAKVCNKHNIFVIFDSIYAHPYDYDNTAFTLFSEVCPERSIISAGLSKIFSCGGWRLGFLILPKHKASKKISDSLLFLMSETISGVNVPLQLAAIEAYKDSVSIHQYLSRTKKIFTLVTRYMWEKLNELNIRTPKPQGGFYVFPNFKFYKNALNKQGIFTSKDLDKKLRELNIYTLPGEVFGMHGEELTLRFAVVDFDGPQILEKISNNPSLCSKEHIEYLMPKLKRACDKIRLFLESLLYS